jgi:hypothetical protein
MSDGRTPTEAIENATKAIDEWINEAVRQQPRPASTEPIETRVGDFPRSSRKPPSEIKKTGVVTPVFFLCVGISFA